MIELFGADYSVYVRSARLALAEKGVDYSLVPVDVFATGGPPSDHLDRQPFGKIPAFRHDGFSLYETGAILRYVDEAFTGPDLQPRDVQARARMNQILSILDAHAYPTLVWGIYVERVAKTRDGSPADEVTIASAMGRARTIVSTLEGLTQEGPFLLGQQLTLADCHAVPMLALFHESEEGEFLLRCAPRLSDWLMSFRTRDSFTATMPADQS